MRNRVRPGVIKLLVILVFIIGFFNCAPDEVCIGLNNTELRIDFKRVVYPDTDSAFVENDTLIFYQISAEDTDSVFVELDTLSRVFLPVNTGQNETTFLFDTDRGSHSLNLSYRRTSRLASVDCGPEQLIEQLTTGPSSFDSVAVLQPALTDIPNTNVEVYH